MGIQKNLLCKGEILKEFLVWGNAKHAHLAGGNKLINPCFFLTKESKTPKRKQRTLGWVSNIQIIDRNA
jgi:hypothetical protein